MQTPLFRRRALAGVAMVAGLVGPSAGASGPVPRYELVDLTTEAGDDTGEATDINESGQVVGYSGLGWVRWNPTDAGWVTTPLDFEDPFCLGVDDVPAINNRGQAVGSAICEFLLYVPLLWEPEETKAPFIPGLTYATPQDINDRGQIVGWGSAFLAGAWVWENGVVTVLGDADAFANGINERSEIVGATGDLRGVVWVPSKDPPGWEPIDLGTLGGDVTIASDINEQSQVVGVSALPDGTTSHAFMWDDDLLMDLGDLPGLENTVGFALNNLGQVVGWAVSRDSEIWHALLWQDGTMYDLDDLVVVGPDVELRGAQGINDRGQIVGWSKTAEANFHAFLLNPLTSGDLDADGDVDVVDLALLLRAWGPCPDCKKPLSCLADLDGDCRVSTSDLLILLGSWG